MDHSLLVIKDQGFARIALFLEALWTWLRCLLRSPALHIQLSLYMTQMLRLELIVYRIDATLIIRLRTFMEIYCFTLLFTLFRLS